MNVKVIRYEFVDHPRATQKVPMCVLKTNFTGKVKQISIEKARIELLNYGWKLKPTDVLVGRIITIPVES